MTKAALLTQPSPPPQSAFVRDVLAGLAAPQKSVPCQWLYDAAGSALFEDITALPEYYPTRAETAILAARAGAIAAAAGSGAALVEYGAGASVKTRLLLDALDAPALYAPIDVSADFLAETAERLRRAYPTLPIAPIVADFHSPIALDLPQGARPVGFFPGSTIGNMSDAEIEAFLGEAQRALGAQALFVLGADLRKDRQTLIAAYDDAAGVTAAFNLNLLTRINRELGGDFDLGAFAHEARWNETRSRIEMHLVSQCAQSVRIAGRRFTFAAGESIHTENSRKFASSEVEALAAQCGWAAEAQWTDAEGRFAVLLFRAR